MSYHDHVGDAWDDLDRAMATGIMQFGVNSDQGQRKPLMVIKTDEDGDLVIKFSGDASVAEIAATFKRTGFTS